MKPSTFYIRPYQRRRLTKQEIRHGVKRDKPFKYAIWRALGAAHQSDMIESYHHTLKEAEAILLTLNKGRGE